MVGKRGGGILEGHQPVIGIRAKLGRAPRARICLWPPQEKELRVEIEKGLKSVNLWANGLASKRVGQFSGGMKRRLSVAISLIGNPAIVYMDEPSTVSPAYAPSVAAQCCKSFFRVWADPPL